MGIFKKLGKYKVLIIIIILVIVFSFLCWFVFGNKGKEDIKVSKLMVLEPLKTSNEAQAAKMIKENIVRIVNTIDGDTKIVGTGFFVKEGYLLTNSHIVDILGDISVEYSDGKVSDAYLYANSIEQDIALLKVDDVSVKALKMVSSNNMEVTNTVLSAGYIYNFAGEATVSKGILSARRNAMGLTYLQTDLALDTGASGGPLFNDRGEVVGLNTFVTENRTFALSLSSETVNMLMVALLEEPVVQYLKQERPANPVNKVLVEVNYTDKEDFSLYNDFDFIKKSNEKHKNKTDSKDNKVQDKNDTIIFYDDKTPKYYCEDGYMLVGRQCVKTEVYDATLVYEDCPSGYTEKDGNACLKVEVKPYTVEYLCSDSRYKPNADRQCEYEGYISDGTKFFDSRLGSCPAGEKCYEYAADFGNFYAIPKCDNYLPDYSTFIWEGEELVDSNYKTFDRGMYNFVDVKSTDENGRLVFAQVGVKGGLSPYRACYTSVSKDDAERDIYVVKKADSIRNTACSEGSLKAFNNENGFAGYACLLDEKPSLFYWNVRCSNPDAVVVQDTDKSEPYCAVYRKDYLIPYAINEYCEGDGYELVIENKTCEKRNFLYKEFHYECQDDGRLEREKCFVDVTKPALKK